MENRDSRRLVGSTLPKWYALSRAWRGYYRLCQRDWRRLCALSLSATYGLLLLLASFCIATGIFHVEAPHDAQHHHAPPGAHHHAGSDTRHPAPPDAHHTSPLPDICDMVHQAFTAMVLWTVPLPTLALPQGQALVETVRSLVDSTPPIPFSIRAPPEVIS